jgi:hypothetical protein
LPNADADIIVVGAGLAGLAAAAEAADLGRRVVILDQEGENSIGGQAFWSLGGLFMVDTPEQRRLGIRDGRDLAWQDWLASAQFDRADDQWPRRVAEAFVDFAAGEMRPWLRGMGMRWFPIVGWAERGTGRARAAPPRGWPAPAHDGNHGNSVPRFHVTWGTGPAVVAPFERRVRAHATVGRITIRARHQVTRIVREAGRVAGVGGCVLEPSAVARGQRSGRGVVGEFEFRAGAVIVTSGGIGGNLDLVRERWPVGRLGPAPRSMVCGVPHHVDGRMVAVAQAAGAAMINADRMWHYTEGIRNWNPIWPNHGIRILPGPSSLWLDALGERLPPPCLPGFDTLATLRRILSTGHEHSWFILTQSIIRKEFALSGSEQNPDLTGRRVWLTLRSRVLGRAAPPPVEAFKRHGEDFVVRRSLRDLVDGMNALTPRPLLAIDRVREQVEARDREMGNPNSTDAQVAAIHAARRYIGDRVSRTARPHRILDPAHGPLIAVRLHVLTRKTLGGLHTDLQSRVLNAHGVPVSGLYAAGEVAGFGGGGFHGYNALEGTFLGGCMFSGRNAGRDAAASV